VVELEQNVTKSPPKVGKTRFVAIDGHGGSGKSTLAKMLAKQSFLLE
jgi:ABC-type bacteriocin/lantibiotic exporter with double-glycine peptidase domain